MNTGKEEIRAMSLGYPLALFDHPIERFNTLDGNMTQRNAHGDVKTAIVIGSIANAALNALTKPVGSLTAGKDRRAIASFGLKSIDQGIDNILGVANVDKELLRHDQDSSVRDISVGGFNEHQQLPLEPLLEANQRGILRRVYRRHSCDFDGHIEADTFAIVLT